MKEILKMINMKEKENLLNNGDGYEKDFKNNRNEENFRNDVNEGE